MNESVWREKEDEPFVCHKYNSFLWKELFFYLKIIENLCILVKEFIQARKEPNNVSLFFIFHFYFVLFIKYF